ncbi:RINT1-like protein [Condylostylus longicornis]|uniref:RINT1-like protein n=1 Tax=Condylostylus longicornis TaxID=2530218 RepID=UPI00244DE97E|nr:RINT1-like protein [Condylostylus longicornis]
MSRIQEKVIGKINAEIGDDIKNLHKAKYLIESYHTLFKDIEGKLNLDNESYTSVTKSAWKQTQHTIEAIDFELAKIDQFDKKLSTKINDCNVVIKEVKPYLENIKNLQQFIEYLRIIQDIQEINNALGVAINGRDETKMVALFLSLGGEHSSANSIVGRLENIEARFLKAYAIKSSVYWYNILKEKFSNDFETTLKAIKWPPQQQVIETFSPSKENMEKLTLLAEYLFLMKSPEEDGSTNFVTIIPSIVCPPISIPTELLLRPFRQRFFYHFTGTRQTNRLDKPEWYFTQVLNWAKENHLFVGKHFQSAAIKAGHENYNVRLEFIRGLVQLTIEKLGYDIADICQDETLFAHLLDETLAFEIELRETLGYPTSFPSALNVITQPQYLIKWISIEERFCTDKMDCVLQGDSPWMLIDSSNMEELKIPKCADQFIRLLDSIKDRYSALTQPGHQLQFLNLQLELIDNFRLRLVQLYGSGAVGTTSILNAINYINAVLKEWGENVHYLHLHAALVGPNVNEINSVFEQASEELEHWQENLLRDLSEKIVGEIKAKSMHYRHDNWSLLPEQNTKEPFMLSSSASDMFHVMMINLHNLEKDLSLNLFNSAIRLISQQLDEFFLDSMVMNTKFSVGGAAQFQFDMTRNLFALFGQYSRRSDLLFKRVHDVCLLLTTSVGSTLLLYQTLKQDVTPEHKQKALKEFGILFLKPDVCIDILERRKDIRIC